MMKIKTFVFLIMASLSVSLFAQEKFLTLEDLNFGGTNYGQEHVVDMVG